MKKDSVNIIYEIHDGFATLSDSQKLLLEAAYEATEGAYAPYSKYHVGAALLLENGLIIKASNQENASYPCGICAERNVLFYYGANYRAFKILKLAISTRSQNSSLILPPAPCGLCRQVMIEYELNNQIPVEVLLGQAENTIAVFESCAALLPFGFHSAHLQNN